MLDYTGFDEKIITAGCGDTEIAGKPLTINHDGSVCLASSGETFLGFGVVERNNFATVQVGGYVEVQGSGDDIRYGLQTVVADGKGGICKAENGNIVQVIKYDYETKKVGIIF